MNRVPTFLIRSYGIISAHRSGLCGALGALALIAEVSSCCLSHEHVVAENGQARAGSEEEEVSVAVTGDIVAVATIEIQDEIRRAVRQELREHGIECYIEGSLVYSVMVARRDAVRAREIISRSERLQKMRVKLVDQH